MVDCLPKSCEPTTIDGRLAVAIVEAIPLAVAVLDTQDRLIAWNSRWAEEFCHVAEQACVVGTDLGDVLAEALAAGLYDPSAAPVLDLVVAPGESTAAVLALDSRGRHLSHRRAPMPGIGTLLLIDDVGGAHADAQRPGVDPETELADRASLMAEVQRRIDVGVPSALLMVRMPEHGGSAGMSRGALALVEAFGADGLIGRLRGLEIGILVPMDASEDLIQWRRRVVEAVASSTVVRVATGVLPSDGSAIDAVRAVARGLDASALH